MNSVSAFKFVTDIAIAFVLLTRLPIPHLPEHAFDRASQAVWSYGIVGAVLGVIAVAVGNIALQLGLPAVMAGGLALACLCLATGAMHEDGLADTTDGLWGGQTIARRLEIMKDSQIGSYGTLALMVVVGLRWASYAILLPVSGGAIIAAASLSRATMPLVMHHLPHARSDGVSHSVGRPTATASLTGMAAAVLIALAVTGATAFAAGLICLAATGGIIAVSKTKISGQTGDVLGATQQVAEIAVLCLYVALVT